MTFLNLSAFVVTLYGAHMWVNSRNTTQATANDGKCAPPLSELVLLLNRILEIGRVGPSLARADLGAWDGHGCTQVFGALSCGFGGTFFSDKKITIVPGQTGNEIEQPVSRCFACEAIAAVTIFW